MALYKSVYYYYYYYYYSQCAVIDYSLNALGNESVPIQLAQCRFPGLAISNAKINTFSNKTYGRYFIKQHSETVWFEITKMSVTV